MSADDILRRREIDHDELLGWEIAFDVQDDGTEHIRHPGYDQRGQCMVRPPVSTEPLDNPGIGYQTFNRFRGDPVYDEWDVDDTGWGTLGDGPPAYKRWFAGLTEAPPRPPRTAHPDPREYPRSSTAYFRWYWAHLEPGPGEVRWELLDWALDEAGRRGQCVHLRIMPHDGASLLPAWAPGHMKTRRVGPQGALVPDYDDPRFRAATERLVLGLAERYDGHPALDAVDIGTLGFWGEWHLGLGTPMTDEAGLRWAVDVYADAFRRTPLMMPIGDVRALAYAVSRGTGWRADCWGDQRPGSWSHMLRRYPRNIHRAGAADAWTRAPVSLETCASMQHWVSGRYGPDYDLGYALGEAIRWHASTINNKSSRVPEGWDEAVETSRRRLGYRYELREIAYPRAAVPGRPWVLDQWWVNSGNAPCYRDYRLVVRLQGMGRRLALELPHALEAWRPGDDQCPADRIIIPPTTPPGRYELSLGIVLAGDPEPRVLPANEGRDAAGWLRIGGVDVAG